MNDQEKTKQQLVNELAALRRSEEQYRRLIDEMSDGYVVTQDERVVFANEPIAQMVGCAADELVGRSWKDFFELDVADYIDRTPMVNLPPLFQAQIHRPDGGELSVELSVRPATYDGKLAEFTLIRDITGRKRMEALTRTQRDLAIHLSATARLDAALSLCVEAATTVAGMECGWIHLVNPRVGTLDLAFHKGLSAHFVKNAAHYEEDSTYARLVMAGQPIYTARQTLDLATDHPQLVQGMRTSAVIPILHQEQVIACLSVASHTVDEIPPTTRSALETVAAQIGSAIARLRAEEALRENKEQKFRGLVEHSLDGIILTDEQGTIIEWNRGQEQMTGLQQAQVSGQPSWDVLFQVVPEEQRTPTAYQSLKANVLEILDMGTTSGSSRFWEQEIQHTDGTRRILQQRVFPIKTDKGFMVAGIARDITERKQAEERMRRQDAILKAVSFAAGQFLETAHWEQNIDQVLERLGQATGVSRVCICENHISQDGEQFPRQRCEWAAPGVNLHTGDLASQATSWKTGDLQRWVETLARGAVVAGHLGEFPVGEREMLAQQGIQSMLMVPIFVGQDWWGLIRFEECQVEREWSTAEVDALKTAASILGAAIHRVQAEEALLESQRTLWTLMRNLPGMAYRCRNEPDWTMEFVSQGSVALTGYQPEDLIDNQTIAFGELIHADDRDKIWNSVQTSLQRKEPFQFTYRIITASGEIKYVWEQGRGLFSAQGHLLGLEGFIADITERIQVEKALRQRTAQLEALRQVGLEITAKLDLDALLYSIVSRAVELLEGVSGTLFLHRPAQDILELVTVVGLSVSFTSSPLQRGEGLAGKVWETEEPLIVSRYRSEEERAATYEDSAQTTVVAVPVRWGQEFLGVLTVTVTPLRTISPEDAELLGLFATQAAIAIRNARLLADLSRQSVLLQTAVEVSKSTSTILDPEELMNQAVHLIQESFDFYYVGLFLVGESKEHAVLQAGTGQAGRKLLSEGHQLALGDQSMIGWSIANAQARVALDVGQEAARFENPYLPDTRSELALPLISRGRSIGALTVQSAHEAAFQAQDIAALQTMADQLAIAIENAQLYKAAQHEIVERERAEEAMRDSEKRYELAISAGKVGIWDWNVKTSETYIAPNLKAMLGFQDHEIPNYIDDWNRLVHPEDAERVTEQINAHLEGSTPRYEIEHRMLHKDGSIRWFLARGTLMRDALGRPYRMMGSNTDITARVQAEEALQRRNLELALLNQASQAFSATLDLDKVLIAILQEVRHLLGVAACLAWLIDPDADELVCRQASGLESKEVYGWRLTPQEGLVGWVARHGKSLIVSDAQKDARHLEGLDQKTGLTLRSILSVPLHITNDVIGVLQAIDTEINYFKTEDLSLLDPLSVTAAMAIENARLFKQAHQDAQTKSVLLREVNHRVKNNLSTIIGMLYAARRYAGVEDLPTYQSIMNDLVNRVQGLATVHSLLSASQWAPLLLSELATQVIRSALQSLPRDKAITVQVPISPVRVMPNQAHHVALVINELATNSVKYALTERDAACISVRIDSDNDTVSFEFRDDGPGYPEDVLRLERHSAGFELIQNIVRHSLRGGLSLHNDQGAVATIQFEFETESEEDNQ